MKDDEEEIDYVGILNRVLVKDIRVFAWAPVALDFSARSVRLLVMEKLILQVLYYPANVQVLVLP